jgi:nicotinate-nucleotide adenylyltransferase
VRIAIFGGTFDPIHCAHLAVAHEAAAAFQLDRVLFVVAANPPHKPGVRIESFEDRLEMAKIATSSEPLFEVSDMEAGTARSYSINTIQKMRAKLAPEDRLFFLIGADAFAEIRSWHRWQDVVASVEFIVAARPGHVFSVPENATVHRLDTLALQVSSSKVRSELAAGLSPDEIAPAVLSYIREHGLYLHRVS